MRINGGKRAAAGGLALLAALSVTACRHTEDGASAAPAPSASHSTQGTASPAPAPNSTEPAQTSAPSQADVGTLPPYCWNIADTSINIRPEPNTYKEAIGGMKKGEMAQVLGKEGDWYKIQILSLVGYVSGQYLSFTDPALAGTASPTAGTTAAAAP